MTREDISAVMIQMTSSEKDVLFLVLGDDGNITRKGDGSVSGIDNTIYIGLDKNNILDQLKSHISPEMLNIFGRIYDMPDKLGEVCTLTIRLKGNNQETGFKITYGASSQGAPAEIANLVISAIRLTDGWYEGQKKVATTAQMPNTKEQAGWWRTFIGKLFRK